MPSVTTNRRNDTDDVPRAVGRTLDLLEIVTNAGSINLTSAAAAAELTPTTSLRYLRALESRGYIRRDRAGEFGVGPTLLHLGTSARRDGRFGRLIAVAQGVLDELTAATGESSYLAVADDDRAVYLATSESDRAIRHVGWVGRSVPLTGTAVGAALTTGGLHRRSDTVEPDIAAVAHSVDSGDELRIAVSVIGPAARMTAQPAAATIATAVADAANRIASILDGPGPG